MRWLFILCLFSLSSCISSNISGLYGECEPGYLICNQLLINSDSTYTYYEYWDVGGSHNVIDGYWKKNGDTLLLTLRELAEKSPKNKPTTWAYFC
jgi:hypothetical protein